MHTSHSTTQSTLKPTTSGPEYTAYRRAKSRCNNTNHAAYAYYGGRGIKFLFKNYAEFFRHLGFRPSAKHSLDRIDTNGNYEPGNCRWADKLQQARNMRSNRLFTIEGQTRCLKEWALRLGTDYHLVYIRISRGWCFMCAFTLRQSVGGQGGCPHR